MSLVTRQGKGSRLTIEEMDNNFLYLQELAQNGLTYSYINSQGPQGATGPQGIQGIQGIAGQQGPQGATGPQGEIGATGPQGIQGAQGNAGPVGPAGLTWAGIWIATQSYQQNYAVGYASASWWCITSVTGSISNISPDLDNTNWALLAAQGSPGPQGAQGSPGPQGSQGIQGATGPQGLQGPQGPQGLQGATGPQGATAITNIEVISTSVMATASLIIYDYNFNNLWYHATASNNFTANFINLPITNNRISTASILINQGSIAYIPNIVQINGVTQSIKWAAGTQSGTINGLDLISFSFIRTDNNWTNVIGQIAPFY